MSVPSRWGPPFGPSLLSRLWLFCLCCLCRLYKFVFDPVPGLASTPLVSGPSGASDGCPRVPSKSYGSSLPAALPSFPPAPLCSSPFWVSSIERFSRTCGFSSSVSGHLACFGLSSAGAHYRATWSSYRTWCARYGLSVARPSVLRVSSFLLSLIRSLHSSLGGFSRVLSFFGVLTCSLGLLLSWDIPGSSSFCSLAPSQSVGVLQALSSRVSFSGAVLFLCFLPKF